VSLFRPESLHSQRQAWLGSIQVMQPLGLIWLSFGVLATLVAVSTFLFWGEASRKVRLTGVLVPDRGLIRIVPPAAGSLLAMAVHEGQSVQLGQVLFTLQVDSPQLNSGSQAGLQHTFDARLRSFDEAARQAVVLSTERQQALDARIVAAQRELAQLDAQAGLQQQRLALAEKALQRLESLGQQAFVSSAQVQAKQEDVLGLRSDMAGLARQRQALLRDITTLTADRREVPLQTAQRQGELERDRAEIVEFAARADAQAAQRQLVVRAPADGVLTSLNVSVGQAVTADAALASLTPAGAVMQAQLYAPSSALGFVRPGQRVQLRLQAFPYQKFGLQAGRVSSVAQAPVQATELANVPLSARPTGDEPVYRITVALDHQQVQVGGLARALLPGMQLDADVVLERRRLVEWLFEPLMGWAKRG
jgi:membrane fusion protein